RTLTAVAQAKRDVDLGESGNAVAGDDFDALAHHAAPRNSLIANLSLAATAVPRCGVFAWKDTAKMCPSCSTRTRPRAELIRSTRQFVMPRSARNCGLTRETEAG